MDLLGQRTSPGAIKQPNFPTLPEKNLRFSSGSLKDSVFLRFTAWFEKSFVCADRSVSLNISSVRGNLGGVGETC